MIKFLRLCYVFLLSFLTLFYFCITISAQTAMYEVQDIAPGTISNPNVSYFPKKVNDSGFITGSKYSSFVNVAHVWIGSLEYPVGGVSSVGYDITSDGSVVGRGNFSGANYRAYIYSSIDQSIRWLPCPFPSQYGTFCEAYAINNNNIIVGTSDPRFLYPESPEAASKAVLWNNDSATEIIPGTGISIANDINNSDTVAGMVNYEPFIWNSTTGLLRLGGYSNTGSVGRLFFAKAINDSNRVVGGHTASAEGLAQRAFYWDGVSARDIGTLGIESIPYGDSRPVVGANDINNANQVVGDAAVGFDANGLMVTHAFIWDEQNGMRDLNNLIPADSGIVLTQGISINNFGDIVAVGYAVGNNPYIQRGYSLKLPREKLPLIFIPAITGSQLDEIQSDGTRRNLWIGFLQNHDRLTLDPNQSQANIISTDAIRTVFIPIPIPGTMPLQFYFYPQDIYRQILEKLVNEERYVEYQVNGQPSLRTFAGCDVSGQMANRPNLFVFAYDWRKSNIENAQALKEYVGCVRRFYPDSKVNFLAHSMGGLLARRYIISNPNDHHVDKMVTIGSPWLGAPKAINVLKTGNFDLPSIIIWNSTIQRLGVFFKGMHELLPSRTYFDAATRSDFHLTNYGKPFKEEGWDVNGNGTDFENYDYDQTANLLNQQHPRSNPGSANQLFHDTAGQDNWLGDTSGVKYFHIYGQQSYLNTPIQVIAKYRVKCYPSENPENACDRENFYDVIHGRGDKTVPTISAERSFGPYYNLLPRNDMPFFSPNRGQDESVEHTKLTQNPAVQQEVVNFLNTDSQLLAPANQSLKDNFANSTEPLSESGAETVELPLREGYYLNISGINYVEIRDDLGNVNTLLDGGYMLPIPSVNYDITGEKSISITTPTEGSYTFTFRSGSLPIFLETIKGMGNLNPTEVVRYIDLNLPANVNAQFQVSSTEITDLRYDNDEDGTFETSVLPTSHTTGDAARDLTPPTIQINEIVQPSRQLVINASDINSGVRKIYYSFDGINFQEYLSSISLTRSQSGTIYTFADDNAANRSLIKTYTFVPIPIANSAVRPVLECVAANGNGTYTAKFGYKNDNSVSIVIPVGANNKFSPNPQNRNQTTNFQPGRIRFAFEVLFNGSNLVWTLKGPDNQGRTSTASANSVRCQ